VQRISDLSATAKLLASTVREATLRSLLRLWAPELLISLYIALYNKHLCATSNASVTGYGYSSGNLRPDSGSISTALGRFVTFFIGLYEFSYLRRRAAGGIVFGMSVGNFHHRQHGWSRFRLEDSLIIFMESAKHVQ